MKKIINPWLNIDGYFCFGCAPDNEAGVKMEFYEDGDEIVSIWKPEAKYQSWIGGNQKITNHCRYIKNGDTLSQACQYKGRVFGNPCIHQGTTS